MSYHSFSVVSIAREYLDILLQNSNHRRRNSPRNAQVYRKIGDCYRWPSLERDRM